MAIESSPVVVTREVGARWPVFAPRGEAAPGSAGAAARSALSRAAALAADAARHHAAAGWLALALGVLVIAGLFAFAVVIGRMPPFDRFVTDPMFFKRCLVAHVNLALVVWFNAFVACLLFLIPSRRRTNPVATASPWLGAAGVLLLLVGAATPGARPLLSNYVPTIEGGVFQLGQLLFAAAMLAALADARWWPGAGGGSSRLALPPAAIAGLRAAGFAVALAGVTLAIGAARQPAALPIEVRLEFLVWGVGHVLQLVSVIAMLTVWIVLLSGVLGESPVSAPAATALFAAFVLPWTAAPWFALHGIESTAYRHGFTGLMRWCLFPIVTVFLVLCSGAIARAWRAGRIGPRTLREPGFAAFLVSAALTVLGFALGAAIRGSNTMVPAHYHASVGAVTVAFMAATFTLLPSFGVAVPRGWISRAACCQSAVYGLGMLVFASGFALAGAHGMARKAYGAEQAARSLPQTIGLGLMGLGGLVAIAGGLLFLAVVGSCWARRARGADRDRARVRAGDSLMEVGS